MTRAQAVVHVADQLSLLDERRARRLVALVVDVDRAAALEHRRVVDDRAQLARHPFADAARIVTRPLAIEVRLEPVPYRLVEQDAAVARRQDDLHLSGGRISRVEHDHRLASRFLRVPFRALALEIPHARAPAAAARALLTLTVLLGDGAHSESHQGLRVADQHAVARDDEDLPDLLREAGLRLQNASVVCVRGRGGPLEQAALVEARDVEGDPVELVAAREHHGASLYGGGRPSAARDLRRRLRSALHRVPIELLDVRVPGRVPLLDADPQAHRHAARGALEDPLVEHETARRAILEEQIGVVPAASERDPEELSGEGRVDCGRSTGGKGGAVQGRVRAGVSHFATNVRSGEQGVEGWRGLAYIGTHCSWPWPSFLAVGRTAAVSRPHRGSAPSRLGSLAGHRPRRRPGVAG